jgi:hypothetical protein
VRLALASWMLVGCVIDPVDLEGKRCPCPTGSGFVCDPSSDTCVREGSDAGRTDAGRDAGVDAALLEAGTIDAGGDAGRDAGDVDAGADAAVFDPSCASAEGAWFCETFEDPTLPMWDDPTTTGGGMIAVTGLAPRYGARQLEASCDELGDGAYVRRVSVPTATGASGRFYFRAWISVPAFVPEDVAWSVLRFVDDAGEGFNLELDRDGYQLYFSGSGAFLQGAAPTLDAYDCVSGWVDVGDAGSATLRVNGNVRASAVIDTSPAMPMHRVYTGVTYCGGSGLFRVLIDDLAMGPDPLDCLPP